MGDSSAYIAPRCQEYCEGNLAQFYCKECSAIFCEFCYDKEHAGSARKAQHEKITQLRGICSEHKHTLDFFNLTLLQPMCVICKKENLATGNSLHVIDAIEYALPKLKALLMEKLDMARTQLSDMSSELQKVKASAEKTADCTVDHLKACFSHAREILDAREVELVKAIKIRCKEFLEGNSYGVNIQERFAILEEAMAAGESLLKNENKLITEKFSQVYTSLSTLCPFEEPASTRLRFIIEYPQEMFDKLKQVGNISAFAILQGAGAQSNETNVEVKDPAILTARGAMPADQPNRADDEKQSSPYCVFNQLTILQTQDQSTQTDTPEAPKRKHVPKSPSVKVSRQNGTAAVQHKPGDESPCCPDSATKRRKRGGELSHELNKCDDILTQLWASDDSWPFARPVDKKQFPDYYKVIKNPINLQIIKDKMRILRYESAVDFVCDMRQMFKNCRIYNGINSSVYGDCQRLEKEFNRLLKKQFPNFEHVFGP